MTFFDVAYEGTPPWDIGRPQDTVVRLAEAGEIGGSVLDVGCGTGEHALYLAARGNEHAVLERAQPVGLRPAPGHASGDPRDIRRGLDRGLDRASFETNVAEWSIHA